MSLAALVLGMLSAAINYVTSRWGPPTAGRVVLILTVAPMIALLIYCGAILGLAIRTNDMRYFGADMASGLALIATIVWVSSACVGASIGRKRREEHDS